MCKKCAELNKQRVEAQQKAWNGIGTDKIFFLERAATIAQGAYMQQALKHAHYKEDV